MSQGPSSLQASLKSDDGSNNDDGSSSSIQIKERHILQERRIGVWGAISLVMNKTIGSGSSISLVTKRDHG